MTDWISHAQDLLTAQGLVSWGVEYSRGRRTIGYCDYSKKTVFLSKYHLENDDPMEILDTIRHEVAHALTPYDGHGDKWREAAKAIGGTGEQYHTLGKSYPSKWTTRCINGHEPKMFRWDQRTIYNCRCGSLVYIKRSDGTPLNLSNSYVTRFNDRALRRNNPLIDAHGIPLL